MILFVLSIHLFQLQTGSRTVQVPTGAILNTGGATVDVGATVELMENGSYRIATNNPQQLQQQVGIVDIIEGEGENNI